MLQVYEIICWSVIPAILGFHFINLVLSDDSKYQKNRLRNSLTRIHSYIDTLNACYHDGVRFHEVKVIYKNREFGIGVHKTDHSYRYTTYEIFINGDAAGTLHQVGDCCQTYYYFEKQNHRMVSEVMSIVHAGAKEVKKLTDATTEKTASCNMYSYFE